MSLIPDLPPARARSFAAVGLDREYPEIRRTVEGRIDFDRYLLRAKRLRSESYASVFRAIARAVGGAYAAWVKAMRAQRERKRAVAELLSLGDRGLRDLGLNRAGVHFAVDHGREDIPSPANDTTARSPKVA
jgi:uncharacterized protein YjiS (DUF1127 family)